MECKNGNFKKTSTIKERFDANARERVRTYSVNSAFMMLRSLIPTEPADRKLSKIEILRLACSYISHLGSILVTGSCERPATMTLVNDTNSSRRPQICTFCATAAKLELDRDINIFISNKQ